MSTHTHNWFSFIFRTHNTRAFSRTSRKVEVIKLPVVENRSNSMMWLEYSVVFAEWIDFAILEMDLPARLDRMPLASEMTNKEKIHILDILCYKKKAFNMISYVIDDGYYYFVFSLNIFSFVIWITFCMIVSIFLFKFKLIYFVIAKMKIVNLNKEEQERLFTLFCNINIAYSVGVCINLYYNVCVCVCVW